MPETTAPDIRKVYVVRGHTGDDSLYESWDVKAFPDEARARALADELIRRCRECGVHESVPFDRRQQRCWLAGSIEAEPGLSPVLALDPQFQYDQFTGTDYGVIAIAYES